MVTNYECIKNMDIKELAVFLNERDAAYFELGIVFEKTKNWVGIKPKHIKYTFHKVDIANWLESEA
jgi:hypothetical protein